VQALEKIVINTNWISIILVFLFAIIAVLKIIDGDKLKGYVFALFNKGFIQDEVEENTSFFSSFYSLLFIFSSVVLALVTSLLVAETNKNTSFSVSSFFLILGIIWSYFTIKSLLEIGVIRLFFIKKEVRFYVVSKFGYLYSISFFLIIFLVLFRFGPLNFSFFIAATLGLFFLKFVFQVVNNKNLVFGKLFYFILYLCAFEIAPLLIMFKLVL
jgi:hypothetical protein|tara:strand:+ start:3997 stop:4638 length:642 start_codon:yes stop_codon:yes gene_type:complete